MAGFLERLQNEKVLVSDGATGTNLQKVGLIGGIIPEGWVLERPEKILDLESAFIEAGSDIILTCTFGGTKLRLRESPLGQRVHEINQRAAEIAREAANKCPGALVAGSMGPTGLLIKPYGPATTEEVADAYEEQARGLTAGGVDLLVIETMFAINEAQAALEGVRRVTELPVIVSFSYDRGTRSMMGTKPSDVVKAFKPSGVAAIGANCGTTLENMETILKEYMSAAPELVYWVKPNAGLPELGENNEAVYRVTPQAMAEYAEKFVAAGARIVGGCCGSTPEHVAAIAKAVKRN
ncbi:MAG: Bifunctional homocysteine S-methyltransferase/5,10-methylenetetrahydrofolate reductase [Anaerolineales bacterium]|nr:Bifunctional homocysteine S-methyltransferase/5,10-methylenetetrahydrofolate reductase [Anaerolineales bacterium]